MTNINSRVTTTTNTSGNCFLVWFKDLKKKKNLVQYINLGAETSAFEYAWFCMEIGYPILAGAHRYP